MSSPIQQLLGKSPTSSAVSDFLISIGNGNAPSPVVKSYSDAVYLNYYPLGISLLFTPTRGYKPKTGLKYEELDLERLSLDSIDVYNSAKVKDTSKQGTLRPSEVAFATFSGLPLDLDLTADLKDKVGNAILRSPSMTIRGSSTGKDIVGVLGEPDRKGGGGGPSAGSIGIWCQWSADGVMVEFGGDESRGLQAWERGKDAVWRVVTVFTPEMHPTVQ